LQAARATGENILDTLFAGYQVLQGILWLNAKQDIDIGQAGIGIKKTDLVASCCQGNSKVDRRCRLADTTLATGDGNDSG